MSNTPVLICCPSKKKGKSKKRSKKFICQEMSGSNGNSSNCAGNGNSNGNGGNGTNTECGNGDKKKNLMEDIWKVMTPEMLNKLVDILVDDFHLTKEEACKFINQQREGAKLAEKKAQGKCPCAPNMVPAAPNMQVRNFMIKEIVEVVACKLSDYMAMILTARMGTRRQEILAENLNKSIEDYFGIIDDSSFGATLKILCEKLSIWVDNKLDDGMLCDPKKGKSK